jgi:outer membrane autotransporter protein
MNAEGGTLNSTNDKVTTTGDGAVGLISRPSQSGPLLEGALTATNVAVLTSGNAAHGAEAQLGSTLTATGGTIVTEGSGADGLLATGFGAQIAFNGGQVTTQGAQASGLLAQTSGLVNLMNTTVLTTGNSDTGVTLDTSGQISMLRGSVETQGSDGEAIFVTGSGQNQGSFDGTSVKSDHGTGILAQGSADSTLDFQNGASLTAGNGVLLLDQASGTVALNGTNGVQFVGNIDATGASGIANVTLRQNSSLTGAINQNQLTGAIGIAPAEPITGLPPQNVNLLVDPSKWNMTASSTLGQLEVFSGALININFLEANAGPFKTLVVSSLTGNGGIFAMNVDLPNFRGDLLVIQTPTAGFNQHQLQIGNPDQGHDPAPNRALLVAQSAQTSGLEFPSNQVEAGTFKYKTQRGDNTPATPNPNDWYLVRADETTQPTLTASSTPFPTPSPTPLPTPTPLPSPPHPTPTPTPTPGPSPTPRPTPTPSPTPPGGERQIDFPKPLDPQEALTNTANAAIGTYSSTIPIYYADMQTLVERMGELRLAIQAAPSSSQLTGGKGAAESKQPAPLPASPPTNEWGVWIRGFGSGMRINNDVSRVFDQNVGGFQLGADRRLASLWSGDIYLGVFGGYIYASRDFRDGGDGSTNALSLGTYATWIHPQGWYADMVVKYTQMWNTFSTPNLEGFISNGDYDIPAVGGSLEVGKRFELAGGRFFIEPQAQLAGVWEDGMDYTASNGLRVHGDDQTSLRGRLGGRAGIHFDLPQGRAIEPYARAEVIEEFLTGNTVRTNSTNFDIHLSGTTGRFGGGLTARISQSFYIYGEYDYLTGDHIEQPWSVDVGLRWQW